MKAFVITLKDDRYSEQVADRCIASANKYNLTVEKFYGIDKHHAKQFMLDYEMEWTWANNDTEITICEKTGLEMCPYGTADLRKRLGCSMSHYALWKKCVELNEAILILEHDAIFLQELPLIEFNGICQINDPAGAVGNSVWWSDQIKNRAIGVHPKTLIKKGKERCRPDGVAGSSAYLLKSWAAQELITKSHEIGVWPTDSFICQQLFPYI